MNITKVCSEYCIGCGLCKSELDVEMKANAKGYLHPLYKQNEQDFLQKVCPVMENYSERDYNELIWGSVVKAVGAHAQDADIRRKASSGGVLTALALYLLETGKVDGIIQVCADEANPTQTVCRISETREQVLQCCGSRYSISTPWIKLSEQIKEGKKYAAVGKPCDISALRRLQNVNEKYKGIEYLLSFFCAGLPSKDANQELLSRIGCGKNQCVSLNYRGNGWPGYATAVDGSGKEYTMEYSKAWGGILGRDVHPYCRLCLDGIGEAADVSCGDGWYIKDGEPDFTEGEGRNIVFARNQLGMELLIEAQNAGYIDMEDWADLDELKIIQKYQYTRKTTMKAKLAGYHICGRKTPQYDKQLLHKFAQKATGKQKLKVFLGTVKRIVQGKI
uniref:Coenzyme F420 hydrogenase/dehydrogenase, beta subunit C-terminal domain n=1 Tax=Acetatifactor sp. TaxID=1872090 RepID=UPI0040577F94